VHEAAREILGARRKRLRKRLPWRRGAAAGVLLAALAAGALAWQRFGSEPEVVPAVSARPPHALPSAANSEAAVPGAAALGDAG
jgi:hypothetical protein